MPAPLVAAAAPAIAESAVKVLSTDLVSIDGKVFRQVRKKIPRLDAEGRIQLTKRGRVRTRTITENEPVQLHVGLNPIGVGVLAIGAGAALVAWHWAGRPTVTEVREAKGSEGPGVLGILLQLFGGAGAFLGK